MLRGEVSQYTITLLRRICAEFRVIRYMSALLKVISRTPKLGMLGKIVLTVVLVVGVIVGLGFYGYSNVKVESSGNNIIELKLKEGIGSLLDIIRGLTLREWLDEGGGIIDSVKIDTTVDVRNETFVPLFIPAMEHDLSIGGEPIGDPINTPSFWLAPGGNTTVSVTASVPRDQLPGLILQYIYSGGNPDITVKSTTKIVGISVTRTQTVEFTITNPILHILLGNNPASNWREVMTDGFA